jgi:hypothetical protein
MTEGPFTLGYQMFAPRCTQAVQNHVDSKFAATALGGSMAGILTAIVTHPGAVIRNKMQGDLFDSRFQGSPYPTMDQTIQKIYKESGYKGFFTGLKQRGARVAVAVPLYVAYTNILEGWMKK